jgi:hypothetical protein
MNGQVLREAYEIVNGARQDDYGKPQQSFARVARMWSAYLGHTVTGRDVALCMALLKLSREAHRRHYDNLLDAAGYVGLAADMAAWEELE